MRKDKDIQEPAAEAPAGGFPDSHCVKPEAEAVEDVKE